MEHVATLEEVIVDESATSSVQLSNIPKEGSGIIEFSEKGTAPIKRAVLVSKDLMMGTPIRPPGIVELVGLVEAEDAQSAEWIRQLVGQTDMPSAGSISASFLAVVRDSYTLAPRSSNQPMTLESIAAGEPQQVSAYYVGRDNKSHIARVFVNASMPWTQNPDDVLRKRWTGKKISMIAELTWYPSEEAQKAATAFLTQIERRESKMSKKSPEQRIVESVRAVRKEADGGIDWPDIAGLEKKSETPKRVVYATDIQMKPGGAPDDGIENDKLTVAFAINSVSVDEFGAIKGRDYTRFSYGHFTPREDAELIPKFQLKVTGQTLYKGKYAWYTVGPEPHKLYDSVEDVVAKIDELKTKIV